LDSRGGEIVFSITAKNANVYSYFYYSKGDYCGIFHSREMPIETTQNKTRIDTNGHITAHWV